MDDKPLSNCLCRFEDDFCSVHIVLCLLDESIHDVVGVGLIQILHGVLECFHGHIDDVLLFLQTLLHQLQEQMHPLLISCQVLVAQQHHEDRSEGELSLMVDDELRMMILLTVLNQKELLF